MPGIGDIDPRELERAVFLVERISRSVDALAVRFKAIEENVGDTIDVAERGTRKLLDDVQDANYEVDRLFERVEKGAETRVEFLNFGEMGKGVDRWLEVTDRKLKRWADEMKRQMQARGPFALADKGLGLGSAVSGIGALKGQLFQGMPFGMGGLLGMALWGASREEYFNAAARRSIFQLQAVGGAGQKQLGMLTAQARSFYRNFGEQGTELLGQTLGAFAELNIGAEAFNRASISAAGFMKNIAGVATAVDLLNAAQPGTTARLIGETMQNAALGPKDAADQVFRLAASLREAKLNYSVFGAGIVQATSAMRMQNQSLDDTRKNFESLNKAFQAQGMSKQRAAQMALTGTQAATGAVGGLSQGLMGFIASRFQKQGVAEFQGLDPYAAMVKMQEGLATKGPFASMIFRELRSVAVNAAGKGGTADAQRLRQIGALQSIGGMSFEAARAIIDTKDATRELMDPAKRSSEFLKDLNKAFATYARNEDQFTKDMRMLQDTLAQIGGDILTYLVGTGGILMTTFSPSNFGLMLRGVFGGLPGVKALDPKEERKLTALQGLINNVDKARGSALDGVVSKMGAVVNIAKGSVDRTVGNAKGVTGAFETYHNTLENIEAGRTLVGSGGGGGRGPPLHSGGGAVGGKSDAELHDASARAAEEQAAAQRELAARKRRKRPPKRAEAGASPKR